MKLRELVCAMALVWAPAALAQTPRAADQRLQALYESDWAWSMREFAQIDDGEGGITDDDHLPSVTPAAQARRAAHWQEALAALNAIPAEQLSEGERVNAAVLRTNLEIAIADARFREWEMPFNSDSSFWSYLAERQQLRDAAAYRRYIGRMRDTPRYFREQIANMRAGLARGFSVPRVTLEGRDQSIASFTEANVERNPFYAPFATMPTTIPAAEQEALRREARSVIQSAVIPAYQNLLRFYRNDYLSRARTSIGAGEMPNGAEYYAAQIREYTTLDMSAEEVHQLGLREVARIEAEMQAVMREAGFAGSLQAFITFLRTDPQFYARTPDELMMTSAWVAKRADERIGDVIGLLPRRRFGIVPVPDAIAPFYTAGRGGLRSCMMNTYNLASRPLYNIPALTLHECAPGHSMQAALAEERDAMPAFRRYTYFSGYGEGWGLYSEYLGIELGIYRTPYENFGRLSYEMWRAARLVIDTGIHQYGWSREQAIDYLASHTALSQHEVETEVDRYISWPGQALAYKLGELTIRRLRTEAEAALGERFDPRPFHDEILALGSVPLSALEEHMRRYIAARQAVAP
ncbi:DUF885 domain-containing protein [Vitreimonas flagellata]|uniref:DUF885 domain-containing protein n=1 Tax=Vitreimonas flagellata TaxID=2560861 RepID=UPI003B82F4BE